MVEIDIGFDRFHAQVIADHCGDEGVVGELATKIVAVLLLLLFAGPLVYSAARLLSDVL